MAKRQALLAAALSAFLAAGPASASEGEFIGIDVKDICEDPDVNNQAFCDTLFLGVVLGGLMARSGDGICLPPDAAAETLQEIYMDFLWKNYRYGDKPFRDTLIPAFAPHFPCPVGK